MGAGSNLKHGMGLLIASCSAVCRRDFFGGLSKSRFFKKSLTAIRFLRLLRLYGTVVFPKTRIPCLILLRTWLAHAPVIGIVTYETGNRRGTAKRMA